MDWSPTVSAHIENSDNSNTTPESWESGQPVSNDRVSSSSAPGASLHSPAAMGSGASPSEHIRWIPHGDIIQEQFIGSGGFGTVYRGVWCNQVVALKIFHHVSNQLYRESSHLCKLSHRNVVTFYGIWPITPGSLTPAAIVMEFAHGGSLNTLLAETPLLSPATLVSWAIQIATGMAYLHTEAELVHRDLKSSNILIREPLSRPFCEDQLGACVLVISDFGMARHCTDSVMPSNLGTVAYAAPETCRQAAVSFKSDVWSYGVVLWELLTMEIPFKSMEQPHLFYLVAMYNFTLHIPQGVPDLFARLLKDCWSPSPNQRPSFEEIISRLRMLCTCAFINMTSAELSRVQAGWRDSIPAVPPPCHRDLGPESDLAVPLGDSDCSTTTSSVQDVCALSDIQSEDQSQLLQSQWSALLMERQRLAERVHLVEAREEQYQQLCKALRHYFMVSAVLAANQLKVAPPTSAATRLKPPQASSTVPPQQHAGRHPFVRSLFRRRATGSPKVATSSPQNEKSGAGRLPTSSPPSWSSRLKVASLPRSGRSITRFGHQAAVAALPIGHPRCPIPQEHQSVSSNATDGGGETYPPPPSPPTSPPPVLYGCSRGGLPHVSPPANMKHMVHVDSSWLTCDDLAGQLNERTVNLISMASLDDHVPYGSPSYTVKDNSNAFPLEAPGQDVCFHQHHPAGSPALDFLHKTSHLSVGLSNFFLPQLASAACTTDPVAGSSATAKTTVNAATSTSTPRHEAVQEILRDFAYFSPPDSAKLEVAPPGLRRAEPTRRLLFQQQEATAFRQRSVSSPVNPMSGRLWQNHTPEGSDLEGPRPSSARCGPKALAEPSPQQPWDLGLSRHRLAPGQASRHQHQHGKDEDQPLSPLEYALLSALRLTLVGIHLPGKQSPLEASGTGSSVVGENTVLRQALSTVRTGSRQPGATCAAQTGDGSGGGGFARIHSADRRMSSPDKHGEFRLVPPGRSKYCFYCQNCTLPEEEVAAFMQLEPSSSDTQVGPACRQDRHSSLVAMSAGSRRCHDKATTGRLWELPHYLGGGSSPLRDWTSPAGQEKRRGRPVSPGRTVSGRRHLYFPSGGGLRGCGALPSPASQRASSPERQSVSDLVEEPDGSTSFQFGPLQHECPCFRRDSWLPPPLNLSPGASQTDSPGGSSSSEENTYPQVEAMGDRLRPGLHSTSDSTNMETSGRPSSRSSSSSSSSRNESRQSWCLPTASLPNIAFNGPVGEPNGGDLLGVDEQQSGEEGWCAGDNQEDEEDNVFLVKSTSVQVDPRVNEKDEDGVTLIPLDLLLPRSSLPAGCQLPPRYRRPLHRSKAFRKASQTRTPITTTAVSSYCRTRSMPERGTTGEARGERPTTANNHSSAVSYHQVAFESNDLSRSSSNCHDGLLQAGSCADFGGFPFSTLL